MECVGLGVWAPVEVVELVGEGVVAGEAVPANSTVEEAHSVGVGEGEGLRVGPGESVAPVKREEVGECDRDALDDTLEEREGEVERVKLVVLVREPVEEVEVVKEGVTEVEGVRVAVPSWTEGLALVELQKLGVGERVGEAETDTVKLSVEERLCVSVDVGLTVAPVRGLEDPLSPRAPPPPGVKVKSVVEEVEREGDGEGVMEGV